MKELEEIPVLLERICTPVFSHQIRVLLRDWRFHLVLLVGPGVCLGLLVWRLNALAALGTLDPAVVGQQLLREIWLELVVLVLLLIPALAGPAVVLDRRSGTLESLLVTGLSPAALVWGKLSAILAAGLLVLAVALPLLSVPVLLGGVTLGSLARALAVLVCLEVLLALGCLAISSRARQVSGAILTAYALALGVGLWLWVDLTAGGMPAPAGWPRLDGLLGLGEPWPWRGAGAGVRGAALLLVGVLLFLGAAVRVEGNDGRESPVLHWFPSGALLVLWVTGCLEGSAAVPTLVACNMGVLLGSAILLPTGELMPRPARQCLLEGGRRRLLLAPGGVAGMLHLTVQVLLLALLMSLWPGLRGAPGLLVAQGGMLALWLGALGLLAALLLRQATLSRLVVLEAALLVLLVPLALGLTRIPGPSVTASGLAWLSPVTLWQAARDTQLQGAGGLSLAVHGGLAVLLGGGAWLATRGVTARALARARRQESLVRAQRQAWRESGESPA